MHVPVMAAEVLQWLAVRADGTYLDATTGLGNHTAGIARLLDTGRVIAADRDPESLELARRNTAPWSARIEFIEACFSGLRQALARLGIEGVDGLVADLGVSRYQLTDPERGFSLSADGPLDMRMTRSGGETAADIVNQIAEKALADLIFQLGQERGSRKIARAIVRARPIRSTLHLASVVESVKPRTGKLHPATLTFLALRRAVNREEEELQALLDSIPLLARPSGRVVVITFMSIEDRVVKQGFQALARQGRARLLTRHVVRPSDEEVRNNPASRSAKLRALEMQ